MTDQEPVDDQPRPALEPSTSPADRSRMRRGILAVSLLAVSCAACGSTSTNTASTSTSTASNHGLTKRNNGNDLTIASCQEASDGSSVIATGTLRHSLIEPGGTTAAITMTVLDAAGAVISESSTTNGSNWQENPSSPQGTWEVTKGTPWQVSTQLASGFTPTICDVEVNADHA